MVLNGKINGKSSVGEDIVDGNSPIILKIIHCPFSARFCKLECKRTFDANWISQSEVLLHSNAAT